VIRRVAFLSTEELEKAITCGSPTGMAILLPSSGKPLPTSSSTRSDVAKDYLRQETSSLTLELARRREVNTVISAATC
jgi:hypothetical protein